MPDRRQLIDRFGDAWQARDLDAVMSLMAPECAFHASVGPGPGSSYRGRAAVAEAFAALLAGPADPYMTAGPLAVMVAEDFAVTRWRNRVDRPGENPVVVIGCDIFRFDGDAITSKDTYRKVMGSPPC